MCIAFATGVPYTIGTVVRRPRELPVVVLPRQPHELPVTDLEPDLVCTVERGLERRVSYPPPAGRTEQFHRLLHKFSFQTGFEHHRRNAHCERLEVSEDTCGTTPAAAKRTTGQQFLINHVTDLTDR